MEDNKFKDWQANEAKLLADNNYATTRNNRVELQKEGSRQAYDQAITHLEQAIAKSSKNDTVFRDSVNKLITQIKTKKGE